MPPPTYPIPANLPTLHLYRHILREASYLPPAFRETLASTIRERFHRHRYDKIRPKARLSRANTVLRSLRAANSGERRAMNSLIAKGFGREGKRRLELMSRLTRPEAPSDSQALAALLDGKQSEQEAIVKAPKKPKNAFYEQWDQTRITAIMRSQMKQHRETRMTADWPARYIKNVDQDQYVSVNKLNVWGKPIADNVVRSRRARWWKQAANKIMPPLGKGEWELLGRLSSGTQQSEDDWKVPERRTYVRSLHGNPDAESTAWNWKTYATQSVKTAELPKSMAHQLRTGHIDSGPYGGRDRHRNVSARSFRRAYNRTWQLVPWMEQDPNTLKYKFSWGSPMGTAAPATKAQLEMLADESEKKEPQKGKRP